MMIRGFQKYWIKVKILFVFSILFLCIFNIYKVNADEISPSVKIKIDDYHTIYEGDIIDCSITGNPTSKFWMINNQSVHTTFHENKPIIFDPEPTPLNDEYVDLTVRVENDYGSDTDTVKIKIKRIFFGDIHFHSRLSDGRFGIDKLYKNTISDNYLDFACLTDHAECIDEVEYTSFILLMKDFLQNIFYKILRKTEWDEIKEKANEYYNPGVFTTMLGYEYSAGQYHKGGLDNSDYNHQDVCHLNFYYKDVYSDVPELSARDADDFDDIFRIMSEEWDKGHLSVCYPHHPLVFNGIEDNSVNWTCLANNMDDPSDRDKILRGVEMYSCWGNSVGYYSDLPIPWCYEDENFCDNKDAFVENAFWEWCCNDRKNQKFCMMASSDIHNNNRPGSFNPNHKFVHRSFHGTNPAGLIASYAVHNKRDEIWDAMNNCSVYATQLLKIRALAKFDGEMALGRWINCTSPLTINVSAMSTFNGLDSSGKNMCPDGYNKEQLDYPISDIWIIKKDVDKGRPWCKIIYHKKSNNNTEFVSFEDSKVSPNDFYYVAIRQKGQGKEKCDEYMSYLGPVFIDQVV